MKKIILLFICMIFVCSCQQNQLKEKNFSQENSQEDILDQGEEKMESINLVINDEIFEIELENNETTKAFIKKLPMTLSMSDLNHNEKYYYLDESLPADEQNIGNIQTGDVMLFGDNCLVVFYESFSTSYQYTRIGRITDISKLKQTLGSGKVEISFKVVK